MKKIIRKSSLIFLKVLPCIGLFVIGLNLITPLWSEFVKHLNGNLKAAGFAVAIYSITYAVFSIVWAFILIRLRIYKFAILFSFFIMGITFLLYPLIHSLAELYTLQFICGIFAAIQSPAFDSFYSEIISKKIAPLAWGVYTSFFIVGIGIGSIIGAHVTHYFGFSVTFIVMSSFEFLAFFVGLFTLKRKTRSSNLKPGL